MNEQTSSAPTEIAAEIAGSVEAPAIQLRGVSGQLVLDLAPDAPFERLREDARRVMSEVPGRFKGAAVRLNLATREIALFDLRRLTHLLKDEFEVLVTGIYCTSTALNRYAEQELKLKIFLHEGPDVTDALEEEEDAADEPTVEPVAVVETVTAAPAPVVETLPSHRMFPVERTIRSGATVRFPGDIVVYGDVNAGAQVLATGNILVLGSLRGLAHAGCDGDERAVIIGFDLRPTQIRIGKKIAISPEERPRRGATPEIAWVSGDQIVIEDYRGRLPG